MRAKGAKLVRKLINEQTLPSIMGCMPSVDWKQWVKARRDCPGCKKCEGKIRAVREPEMETL
jgi:hypothetical protein